MAARWYDAAVANLCVPYYALDKGLDAALPYVDRSIYPKDTFPYGQWEYMRFYEENFDKATRAFEANPYNTAKALFRKGSPAGIGKPSLTAFVRRNGGWFGGAAEAPRLRAGGHARQHRSRPAGVTGQGRERACGRTPTQGTRSR